MESGHYKPLFPDCEVIDQCSGAGEIAVKKMMGDYCIYCDGILFGLICDNNFYIATLPTLRSLPGRRNESEDS